MPHYNVNPTDSAIFSDGFSLAPHHKAAWPVETKRVQAIRGQVLSEMVGVESEIDYAIADLVLPRPRSVRSPSWMEDRHLLFQNHILTHFDLRTKIEILGDLLSVRFPRDKVAAKAVCSKLDAVRDVRNKVAHCPVYFEALEKRSNGRWLRPHLMTARGMVHLSEGYVRAFKRDALEALNQISNFRRKGLRDRPSEIERLEVNHAAPAKLRAPVRRKTRRKSHRRSR
jgi:hypothetical protein